MFTNKAQAARLLILSTADTWDWVTLCGRLSCTVQNVQQHPWPLPTQCREHTCPPVVTTQTVSGHCQMSPGGPNHTTPPKPLRTTAPDGRQGRSSYDSDDRGNKGRRAVCPAQGHSEKEGQDCERDPGPLQPRGRSCCRASLLELCPSGASIECQQSDRKLAQAACPTSRTGPTGAACPCLSPLLSGSPWSQLWCHEDSLGFDIRPARFPIPLCDILPLGPQAQH